jgi:hypothetical protein
VSNCTMTVVNERDRERTLYVVFFKERLILHRPVFEIVRCNANVQIPCFVRRREMLEYARLRGDYSVNK